MEKIRNIIFITTIALFGFIGCSQKTQIVAQEGSDFIYELPIHDAIRAKDNVLAKDLISKSEKMSIDAKDKYGYTPFHLAVRLNQLDIAKELLNKGANINNKDIYGDTPLLDSTRNSTNAMSRFLICNKASKDVADRFKMTPLHNASKNKDLYIAMMLQSDDLTKMCEPLTISLESYDKNLNEICGDILTGVATDVDITLSGDTIDSMKPKGPFKSEIKGDKYCAVLEDIKDGSNYLITAVGTNGIDKAIATSTLKDLKSKNRSIKGLYDSLVDEFSDDFKTWNTELDKDGLVFRFKDPNVLYEAGSSKINEKFKAILDDFFPRYLKVIKKYKDQIAQVNVDGYTSSEYGIAKNDEQRYQLNKDLSVKRANEVYKYTLNISKDDKEWLDKVYSYRGLSYDSLIYDENGVENKVLSRRVEFKIDKIK